MLRKKKATQCQCMKKAIQDLSRDSLETSGIIDVDRIFLSEYKLAKDKEYSSPIRITASSEPDIYTVNYDDLCGSTWPTSSNNHPSLKEYDVDIIEPILCTWKFITHCDIEYMRLHFFDEIAIKSIIERILPDNLVFDSKRVFLSYAWKFFRYLRENNFSGKGISSALGIFYLTHRFFVSNPWRSARETFAFFNNAVKLHAVLKPPESDMIFDVSECDKLIDMFWSLYIRNLELVRSVCIPKYNLVIKINKCGMKK